MIFKTGYGINPELLGAGTTLVHKTAAVSYTVLEVRRPSFLRKKTRYLLRKSSGQQVEASLSDIRSFCKLEVADES